MANWGRRNWATASRRRVPKVVPESDYSPAAPLRPGLGPAAGSGSEAVLAVGEGADVWAPQPGLGPRRHPVAPGGLATWGVLGQSAVEIWDTGATAARGWPPIGAGKDPAAHEENQVAARPSDRGTRLAE
jgi:hypothetical protein